MSRETLTEAILAGDIEDVERIISNGIAKDVLDQGLLVASDNSDVTFARPGVIRDSPPFVPLQIFDLLVKAGADVNAKGIIGEETPLHKLSSSGHYEAAEYVLNCGAGIDAKAEMGYTPLHYAALAGANRLANLLCERGCNINVTSDHGLTPLHFAALNGYEGHAEIAELLIKKGNADVNAVNSDKQTPLHVAASEGVVKVVELLLDNGADRNLLDMNGDSALALAEKMYSGDDDENYKQIIDLLRTDST